LEEETNGGSKRGDPAFGKNFGGDRSLQIPAKGKNFQNGRGREPTVTVV